jgi:hypothetical protein
LQPASNDEPHRGVEAVATFNYEYRDESVAPSAPTGSPQACDDDDDVIATGAKTNISEAFALDVETRVLFGQLAAACTPSRNLNRPSLKRAKGVIARFSFDKMVYSAWPVERIRTYLCDLLPKLRCIFTPNFFYRVRSGRIFAKETGAKLNVLGVHKANRARGLRTSGKFRKLTDDLVRCADFPHVS